MPFVDVSIRQVLGLVTSTPSEEDLQAAANTHGMTWDPITQALRPLVPLPPVKRAARAKQVSAGDAEHPIQADA
jgi:hypothetical protein